MAGRALTSEVTAPLLRCIPDSGRSPIPGGRPEGMPSGLAPLEEASGVWSVGDECVPAPDCVLAARLRTVGADGLFRDLKSMCRRFAKVEITLRLSRGQRLERGPGEDMPCGAK